MRNNVTSKTPTTYDNAFTARGNAIGQKRIGAKQGKIQNRLGKKDPFTDEFKSLIQSDYLGILGKPFLEKELKEAKMVLRALSAAPQTPETKNLLLGCHGTMRNVVRHVFSAPSGVMKKQRAFSLR
jgi:hypothetical protein